jgi:hypothetical protein
MNNPLAETLKAGRFCFVVELVASALKREAQVLEIGSNLATVPQIVAGRTPCASAPPCARAASRRTCT